jgi:hypothetical protein
VCLHTAYDDKGAPGDQTHSTIHYGNGFVPLWSIHMLGNDLVLIQGNRMKDPTLKLDGLQQTLI